MENWKELVDVLHLCSFCGGDCVSCSGGTTLCDSDPRGLLAQAARVIGELGEAMADQVATVEAAAGVAPVLCGECQYGLFNKTGELNLCGLSSGILKTINPLTDFCSRGVR